jgi:hypothetical protein
MTTLAFYGARLPPLLPQPQMAPFALAMQGVLGVQTASLRPQTVAGRAFFHRLPFMPNVALPLILVMTLGAGHLPGFVYAVAELNRWLTPGPRQGDFKDAGSRRLRRWSGLGPQKD